MKAYKDAIKDRFSQKAASYDSHASVQKEMAHQLIEYVKLVQTLYETEAPKRVLEIGCGTGYLTKLMRVVYPTSGYTALDIAPGMIAEAKKQIESEPLQHEWVVADAEEWVLQQAADSYDLVISNACFQWLSQPKETCRQLSRLLIPDGTLVFSTFGPRTFHELHNSFTQAYQKLGKEPASHILSLRSADEWQRLLEAVGFSVLRMQSQDRVQHFPAVKDFLYSIKQIGANSSGRQSTGIGQKQLLFAMIDAYEQTFRQEAGIAATYDTMAIVARKQA